VIDETRIERALREGPPFPTPYDRRPLLVESESGPRSVSLLAVVVFTVLLVVAVSGAALVGSRVIDPPTPPLPPADAASPNEFARWTWTRTGDMLEPRGLNTTTVLQNGLVLVAGGRRVEGDLASAELYDPATGSWTATGSMDHARVGHTATVLPDGTVLVAGGVDCGADEPPVCTGDDSAELYHPGTGTWTATGSMRHVRGNHSAILLPDGLVLVVGGEGDTIGSRRDFPVSAELYNPSTGEWTATGDRSIAGAGQATLLGNGRVLFTGCCGPNFAELYDPGSGTWTVTESPRASDGSATLLLDGTVLLVGGERVGRAERYDPVTGTWTSAGEMSTDRSSHTATLLQGGEVIVAGGAYGSADSFYLDSTELYDPRSGSWASAAPLNDVRKFHTAVLLPDGRVLVTGGTQGLAEVVRGDAWVWTASAEVFGPVNGD
jgi:hypothetical protein